MSKNENQSEAAAPRRRSRTTGRAGVPPSGGRPAACALRRAGFTLLEVLLAVAIASVALFSIAMAIGRCTDAAKVVSNHTSACDLLEEKLREFANATNFVAGLSTGDFGETMPGFEWSRELEPDDSQLEGLYRQTVTVKWGGRELAVTTLLFAPEAEEGTGGSDGSAPRSSNPASPNSRGGANR